MDPQVQEWDALAQVSEAPQIIVDLLNARHEVARVRAFGRPVEDIQGKCWEVQQLMDRVEMWIDGLREEYPSGARDPE